VTSAIRKNGSNAALVLAISGTATPLSKSQLMKLGWSLIGFALIRREATVP
jgi:hypothetical protein